jgi:exodeoxyribonuclease VII small subunit
MAAKKKSAEPATLSFEAHLEQVQDAIRLLERGDAPLEDSIDIYADAMHHLARCNAVLADAERRLEVVRRTAGGVATVEPAQLDDDGSGVHPLGG